MDHGLRGPAVTAPGIDFSFSHAWTAEILARRPLILPPRHYVYPRDAEEVERGALEVLITPQKRKAPGEPVADPGSGRQPFLATCALGFRDAVVPTGVWSTPEPETICAVSGGYAYMIDTTAPERFAMIPYRPVLEVRPAPADRVLLFVGHHAILAWGPEGQAWESAKLSDEGVTILSIENGLVRGLGWELVSDKETAFALSLETGNFVPSNAHF
jgi:hypothetical protein